VLLFVVPEGQRRQRRSKGDVLLVALVQGTSDDTVGMPVGQTQKEVYGRFSGDLFFLLEQIAT
jgi:hypothetical protein